MKEEIQKIETLLKKVNTFINNQIFVETVDAEEYENVMRPFWEEINIPKSETDKMLALLKDRLDDKNIEELDSNLIALRTLLNETLFHIEKLAIKRKSGKNSNTYSLPNDEFKALIERGIIKTDQDIWGAFKKKTFSGTLTKEGFFELKIQNEKFLCSDFKEAILRAWGKIVPNDGWGVWQTLDAKSGQIKPLSYFRKVLN